MKYGFVVRHGWGFSAREIAPLASALSLLSDRIVVDELGYLGATPDIPPRDPEQEWILLGHSYGFGSLLAEGGTWSAMIGIGGFLRFPAPGITEMRAALERNARATLRAFYRRCGIQTPVDLDHLDNAGVMRLTHALEDIEALDVALPDVPLLMLAGGADRIVSPAWQRDVTSHRPRSMFAQHAQSGHALGMIETGWCIERISAFLRTLHRPAVAAPVEYDGY